MNLKERREQWEGTKEVMKSFEYVKNEAWITILKEKADGGIYYSLFRYFRVGDGVEVSADLVWVNADEMITGLLEYVN